MGLPRLGGRLPSAFVSSWGRRAAFRLQNGGTPGEKANGAGVRLTYSQFIPYGGCCKKKVLVRECSVLFPPLRSSYICHDGRYAGRKARGWSLLARFSMLSGCVVGSSGRKGWGWLVALDVVGWALMPNLFRYLTLRWLAAVMSLCGGPGATIAKAAW